MWSVIKWFLFLPIFFMSSIAAWIVAPVAVLFRHEYSLKGTAFWWTTTPVTDLRGDPDHQEKWHHRNCYLQFVTWIWRNPAVNFQREVLGVDVHPDDDYHQKHTPLDDGGEIKVETVRRDGKLIAWMYFALIPWFFKKDKAVRILLGWKCWDFCVKNPLQMTARITLWKSM
jgi:hypothetical protein